MKIDIRISGLDQLLAKLEKQKRVIEKYSSKSGFVANSVNDDFTPFSSDNILDEAMTPSEFAEKKKSESKYLKKIIKELNS